MKKRKPLIIMVIDFAEETYFYKATLGKDLPKRLSLTKVLGGPEIVTKSRWYCSKGCGGYVTDWQVKVKDKMQAIQSLNNYGIDSYWLSKEDVDNGVLAKLMKGESI